MKTAKEIWDTYSVWSERLDVEVIKAMEEYAAQFRQPTFNKSEAELLFSKDFGRFEKAFQSICEGYATPNEKAFVEDFFNRWKQTQPTTPALIPFSLERALAGDKVVSRQGDEVKEIRLYESAKDARNIVCTVNGVIRAYTIDGCWYEEKATCGLDLFMAQPEVITKWLNLFVNHTADWYDTEDEALSSSNTKLAGYIGTGYTTIVRK